MDVLHKYWLTSHTIVGLVHFISAVIGLILGLGILFLIPGSKLHKRAGYIFIPVLIIVNISALFIHQMSKTFGPFHVLIPFSLYALFMGVKPLYTKMERERKLKYHIRGMLAAALGLWAAFCAEFIARTPFLKRSLYAFGDNPFLAVTIEGFLFVVLFILIINKLKKRQYKRIGLDDK
jgi:uncharacterized membrane protein